MENLPDESVSTLCFANSPVIGLGTVIYRKTLSLLFGLVILPVNLAVPAFIEGVSIDMAADSLKENKQKRQKIK
jgi:hypothetical protein